MDKIEEIEIKTIEKRPGEKLYEELMTEEEAMNAYEDEKRCLLFCHKLTI